MIVMYLTKNLKSYWENGENQSSVLNARYGNKNKRKNISIIEYSPRWL